MTSHVDTAPSGPEKPNASGEGPRPDHRAPKLVEGAKHGKVWGSLKKGGHIHHSGTYRLHKGERVKEGR